MGFKIIAIDGPTGVGKSTILESLGLMNNTIQENGNSVFDFLGESFIDIWDKGEAELKKIPFFVRGKVRRNTEAFAKEKGLIRIDSETLYDAKAHYSA